MHKANVVDIAVREGLTLLVDGKPYTVEFPLTAVIEAEALVGHSLKSPGDWFGAPAKDVPLLLAAGLKAHNEDAAELSAFICSHLNPEMYTEITEALGAIAFPRWLARYKDNLEKLKSKSPKAESADVP